MQIVANEREQFLRAGLDNFREAARENHARRAVADAGNFDGGISAHQSGCRATVMTLDAFGFGNGSAQPDGEIVREVIAADGNGAGVADDSAAVNDDFRGATADVEEAAPEVAFVLCETGFGGGERLEDGVTD